MRQRKRWFTRQVQASAASAAGAAGADGVFANLSAFRLVGKLGSWRGGGEHSRDAGRGRKIAALQKKGVGTPASIFPMKGRRRKEVCPPIVTEQSTEKSEE